MFIDFFHDASSLRLMNCVNRLGGCRAWRAARYELVRSLRSTVA